MTDGEGGTGNITDKFRRLTAINRAITMSLDSAEVLRLIADSTTELVKADVCLLLLDSEKNGRVRICAAKGVDEVNISEFSAQMEESVIEKLQGLLDLDENTSFVCIPILGRDELNGFLAVARVTKFSDEEQWLLSALADQAAIALQNARLFEIEAEKAERERGESQKALSEREQHLQVAIDTAGLGAWDLDLNTGLTNCTESYKAQHGQDPEAEFTYESLLLQIHPEDREGVRKKVERAIIDQGVFNGEYRVFWPDGTLHWIVASGRGIYGSDGQAFRMVGVTLDVTERKFAESERERLLSNEQTARTEAEKSLRLQQDIEERLTLLVEASGVLLGLPTLETVQPAILDLSVKLIEADAYAIWRIDRSTRVWSIVAQAGMSANFLSETIPDAELTFSMLERPFIAEDVSKETGLSARKKMYEAEGIRSFLAVPLRIHGETSGTLTFYYRQHHKFSETEVKVATAVVNLAGGAIRSAELYEVQTRMRSEAEDAERRAQYLAEVSRVLASSLDYKSTLARIAQLSVPDLADWCTIEIAGKGNSIECLAAAHVDSVKGELAEEMRRRYPADTEALLGVPNVLRTGQSVLHTEIPDEMLIAAAKDDEHLKIMREIDFSSAMVVPLLNRERTLGAIIFVCAESRRHYGLADLAFAESLARRGAVAVENARLYQEAGEARQLAEESSRLKNEFLATVSHELRTPLTSILGWTHLLRRKQLDELSASNAIETIERNARSQNKLIDDLLDVSRIITGKLRLDVSRVDPITLIESAIEAILPAARAKEIRLRQVIDSEVNYISGDEARLQQVIWNLLSNAIKFTPKAGQVEVRLERIESHIEIAVRDSGSGINTEFLPYVFDRFRQADGSATRKYGGLGLGLAIARHLVELHGGVIQADSAGEGHGATFTVKLPVVPIFQREVENAREIPFTKDQNQTTESLVNLKGVTVLVVDDEADTRELIKVFLVQRGAEVITAQSSADALDRLEIEVPDVIISDIGMPDEDGFEFIRKVRKRTFGAGGNTPAVALTAYARPEDRIRALRSGYQMHLAKPVEFDELVTVVAKLRNRKIEDNKAD